MATVEQLTRRLEAKQSKIGKLSAQVKEEKVKLAEIRAQIKEAKAAAKAAMPAKAACRKPARKTVATARGRKARTKRR